MRITAETIIVNPINKEKLNAFISKYLPLNEGEEFCFDTDSIFIHNKGCMLIDWECCAGYLDKNFNYKTEKIEPFVGIGIRRWTTYEGGRSLPMSHECYFNIFESDWDQILDKETTLKEFMESRFNYNPRIQRNTYEVESAINELIKN